MLQNPTLRKVDRVRLTSVVDNIVDRGTSSPNDEGIVERYPMTTGMYGRPLPIGEHGFSALIQVCCGERTGAILYDSGVSEQGLIHNIDALNVNIGKIQSIVLSHGHADHYLGLNGLIKLLSGKHVPIIMHPDTYKERMFKETIDGDEIVMTPLNLRDFEVHGGRIIKERKHSFIVDDMVLVSGEVTRITDFERGLSLHWTKRNDRWELDPLIMDDQYVAVNVRGKGLVIVTGCSHAGIINILLHAQEITGIKQIHAVFGGFHLYNNDIILPTLEALLEIKPRYLIPTHCTGWTALHQISRVMPEAFIPNSVGSTYVF